MSTADSAQPRNCPFPLVGTWGLGTLLPREYTVVRSTPTVVRSTPTVVRSHVERVKIRNYKHVNGTETQRIIPLKYRSRKRNGNFFYDPYCRCYQRHSENFLIMNIPLHDLSWYPTCVQASAPYLLLLLSYRDWNWREELQKRTFCNIYVLYAEANMYLKHSYNEVQQWVEEVQRLSR